MKYVICIAEEHAAPDFSFVRAEVEVPPVEQLTHDAAQRGLGHQVVGEVLRIIAEDLTAAEATVPHQPGWFTIADIARMCGVQPQTVHRWRTRDRSDTATMPAPKIRVAERPLWDPAEVTAWAKASGKFHVDVTGEVINA